MLATVTVSSLFKHWSTCSIDFGLRQFHHTIRALQTRSKLAAALQQANKTLHRGDVQVMLTPICKRQLQPCAWPRHPCTKLLPHNLSIHL